MLYVYLDQNKWIELARAAKGQARAKQYGDVLLLAREASKRKIAGFPLSAVHYMENWNSRRASWRKDVGTLMLDLSRPVSEVGPLTIAAMPDLLPCEIDVALHRRYGKPRSPRSYPVFGVGVAHAFGNPDLATSPDFYPLGIPGNTRVAFNRLIESFALIGPPSDFSAAEFEGKSYRTYSFDYMESEQNLATLFRRHRLSRGERVNTLVARSLLDIVDLLNEALELARISRKESADLDTAEGLNSLLADIPIQHVDYELRRVRHGDKTAKWGKGDLNDLAALSAAVVHCDVVVTEKQWAHYIRQCRLDQQYGTVVFHDLRGLAPILARGSA